MLTESGQWDYSRLSCLSTDPGSQERTGNSQVITDRGPGAKGDGRS